MRVVCGLPRGVRVTSALSSRPMADMDGQISSGSPPEGSVPDSPAGSFVGDLSQMLIRVKAIRAFSL